MLFNSVEFIFFFLPFSLFGYFLLNRYGLYKLSNLWLAACSLGFYSWWNISYLPLLCGSIIFNYFTGTSLSRMPAGSRYRRALLVIGICGNVALLAYFKYMDFFITNVNAFFRMDMPLLRIVLPLGISFFTFTQIAFLADCHRGECREYSFFNYVLFVTFFPHLIAGPIIHHKEMMPQFESLENKRLDYKNLSAGLFLFSVGLFKKVVIADRLAPFAAKGFDSGGALTFVDGWTAALAYTFQIYFDFSGYTDMAIGAAMMFNVFLPPNFNSPYKALSVRDFWRRWHITLSRFLRDYIYIPLGGSRAGKSRTHFNVILTFFIGGLWHGAGWTFLIWGLLHGAALSVQRLWEETGVKLNKYLSWTLTFLFVVVTWVFFRAKNVGAAGRVLTAMSGLSGFAMPSFLQKFGIGRHLADADLIKMNSKVFLWLISTAVLTLFLKNSLQLLKDFRPNKRTLVFCMALAFYSILQLNKTSDFLYFNF
ncbi:MAG: MBOAT family protein [Nitrospirota bacterium]